MERKSTKNRHLLYVQEVELPRGLLELTVYETEGKRSLELGYRNGIPKEIKQEVVKIIRKYRGFDDPTNLSDEFLKDMSELKQRYKQQNPSMGEN